MYLKASLFKRHLFYKKNINSFKKVICFGNLPPSVRLNAEVYTYFQQRLFLSIPENIILKQKILLCFKSIIFKYLHKYTDSWIVQSSTIQNELSERFKKINKEKVLVLPFYPEFKLNDSTQKVKNRYGFLYVSSGESYKNHILLLRAFEKIYKKYKVGQLHLTIDNQYQELNSIIKNLVEDGCPIVNHGYVDRKRLEQIYEENTFCIYPSLTESFGLGIIEAIDKGCKIIGADLPYTYSVCEPSLSFNPYKQESIYASIEKAMLYNLPPTTKKVSNKINEIIKLLKE